MNIDQRLTSLEKALTPRELRKRLLFEFKGGATRHAKLTIYKGLAPKDYFLDSATLDRYIVSDDYKNTEHFVNNTPRPKDTFGSVENPAKLELYII